MKIINSVRLKLSRDSRGFLLWIMFEEALKAWQGQCFRHFQLKQDFPECPNCATIIKSESGRLENTAPVHKSA